MNEENHRDLLKDLFPIGKERWLKVKYKDLEWCIKNIRLNKDHSPIPGFDVVAVGVLDEYTPQISAIMDLKAEVIGFLYGNPNMPQDMLEHINGLFIRKMDELKAHVIQDAKNESPT